jgi:cell filamentation protein
MGLKYHLVHSDIYINGTDIPKNKANITNSKEIHLLEKLLLEEAYIIFEKELHEYTVFNENYFINLHKRTFETLYTWAGKYRNFDMAKGGTRFCQAMFLNNSAKIIFQDLEKDNYLRDYSLEGKKYEFSEKIAYYKCELIALHPFPEINGRITRMFFDMIAIYNGYDTIDYSHITREDYINASIEGMTSTTDFQKIIFNGLDKIR